jgi:catechol 2,3-dioxygenase-like lactoylglutathione lyase family enzyme
MAVRRFSHLGLCVADLERSLRFYRDGLGFRERSSLDVGG